MKPLTLLLIFLGTLILWIVISTVAAFNWESGYKEGNIDALTGKPGYKLTTNADSTKDWQILKNYRR